MIATIIWWIIYIGIGVVVAIVFLVLLTGYILSKGFQGREDPEILNKWEHQSRLSNLQDD